MKNVIFIYFILISCILNAQEKKLTWDYPVKPGTVEWKELKSHKEMVDVCQIPTNTLSTIPTGELAQLCMNYPLFFTMTAFNNLQEGFNQVSTEFNGFQELFIRADAGVVLLEIYKKYKPKNVQVIEDLISRGKHKYCLFFIEFTLSQQIVFEKLSNIEKRALLSETILKTEEKSKAGFSTFNKQATSLIAVRILENEPVINQIKEEKSDKYRLFSISVLLTEKDMIDEIKNATIKYLNLSNHE